MSPDGPSTSPGRSGGGISAPALSLPKGGGAVRGLGESFESQDFRGTAGFSIPLPVPAARGLEPDLRLAYGSGGGTGIFGMGFDLALPAIARKTSDGVPRYDGSDVFVLSDEGELTPALPADGIGSPRDGEAEWQVAAYRPRHEGPFATIERRTRLATGESHWRVRTRADELHTFGLTANARIFDPEHPERVFQWLIEETLDARGNKIRYTYKPEDGDSAPETAGEAGRDHRTNRYVSRIDYGNYRVRGDERFAFQIVFDYGEHSLDDPEAPPGTWAARPDPFSSYRSGFEIRTLRRCENVLIHHCFHDRHGGRPFRTRTLHFDYRRPAAPSAPGPPVPPERPASGLSFLRRVEETGWRKQEDGSYLRESLPPLVFTYSGFDPAGQTWRTLEVEGRGAFPGRLTEGRYLPVDLRGEGLPGILYSDGVTTLFWEPLGGGRYSGPRAPESFPGDRDLGDSELTLSSLEGVGEPDLVVRKPGRSGFYRASGAGIWEPFQPFAYVPTELVDPRAQLVDLDGSGRPDLAVFAPRRLRSYPSLGLSGYGPPAETPIEPGFPVAEGGRQEVVTFADVFGDGLAHRVRIRAGSVECWPALGHGRFGRKVTLDGAPRFGGTLDARRLFLADVDGSGTADLVYMSSDHFQVWFNRGGNRFSEPLTLPLPAPYDDLCQVSFADVYGNGTSCLILTRLTPEVRHHVYDFAGDRKPHLLTAIDNRMGATTRIRYTTSVKQYLEDKRAGRPWPTRLFFPVQVVEEVERRDEISGAGYVRRHRYHDGYYDPRERAFRGFGFVEIWDAEDFGKSEAPAGDPAVQARHLDRDLNLDRHLHVPPAYTRTWYHTGAPPGDGVVSRHYAGQYWQGDPLAFDLPDGTFDRRILREGGDTVRQAYEALAGKMLRREVYGLDGSAAARHPYTVSEANVRVRLIQPRKDRRYAVLHAFTEESLACHYERRPADPRIEHQLNLEVDDFGNVTRSCSVAYPRRESDGLTVYPEQRELRCVVVEESFINHPETPEEPYRRLGVSCESREYEVRGLAPPERCFSLADLEQQVAEALRHPLAFGVPFTPGRRQARLFSRARSYFWNEARSDALPLARIASQGLLHHEEAAVLTPELVGEAFGGKVDPELLAGDGGYRLEEGIWWSRGLIQRYFGEAGFFLPRQTDGAFDGVDPGGPLNPTTTVDYDGYFLLPTRVTRYLEGAPPQAPGTEPGTEAGGDATLALGVRAENDDHALRPWKLTDPNENVSEVLFDPLGRVVARTVYGTENGEPAGDEPLSGYAPPSGATLRHVLEDRERYLQNATTFFFYDLFAWSRQRRPAVTVGLHRQRHVHPPAAGGTRRPRVEIAYRDGFGRLVESKLETEPGPVAGRDGDGDLVRDGAGKLVPSDAGERWIVSGRTVYNNKGKPAEQYQPYFSPTPAYEAQEKLVEQGLVPPPAVLRYDPLGRVIRTDTPKGFFSKVELSPWEAKHYDENDTVTDSPYYKWFEAQDPDRLAGELADEKDALDKAAVFYDTPSIAVLDNLGRTCRGLEDDLADGRKSHPLTTLHVLDVEGREIRSVDPRLFDANARRGTRHANFTYLYDMAGNVLRRVSADAGTRWSLTDVFGKPVHSWDSRDFHIVRRHDRLGRRTEVRVRGGDGDEPLDHLTEVLIYGEGAAAAAAGNLQGRLHRHYDPAGLVTHAAYGLGGEVTETTRQVRADYRQEADWTPRARRQVAGEEAFTTAFRFDALGRIVEETAPDGSVVTPRYDRAGQLTRVDAAFEDGPAGEVMTKTLVEEIDYDARAQRTFLRYGNGVVTRYVYERTTLRLLGIRTTRSREVLQDVEYTYDPVGNVTRKLDASWETVFHSNQEVEPRSDYTYDALYRLVEATGRQHSGLQGRPDGSLDFLPVRPARGEDRQALEEYVETYRYDAGGNLTRIRHGGSQSWTRKLEVAETSNRLRLPYDRNGNVSRLDHLRALVWNYRNNIARADVIVRDRGTDDGEHYLYDGVGNRVLRVTQRVTAVARKPGEAEVAEIEEKIYLGRYQVRRIKKRSTVEDDTGKRRVDVATILERKSVSVMDDHRRVCILHRWSRDDRRREATEPGQRHYRFQLDDHLGSVALEVDEKGRRITYEEYFPYGGTAFVAGRSAIEVKLKEYRYSGKERDAMTGLYDYGARYYPPWLGRWLNPDPAGTVDGLNLYAFTGGNPVRYVDVRGTCKGKGQAKGKAKPATFRQPKRKRLAEPGKKPGSQPKLPPRPTRKILTARRKGDPEVVDKFQQIMASEQARRKALQDRLTRELRAGARAAASSSSAMTPEDRAMAGPAAPSLSEARSDRPHTFAAETTLLGTASRMATLTTHGTSEPDRQRARKRLRRAASTLTGADPEVMARFDMELDAVHSDDDADTAARRAADMASMIADHPVNIGHFGSASGNRRQSNRPDPTTSHDRTSIEERDAEILDAGEELFGSDYSDDDLDLVAGVPYSPRGVHVISSKMLEDDDFALQ